MNSLKYEVSILLKSIGITGTHKGFYYLRDAVLIVLEDELALCNVHKNIYTVISGKYNVSCGSIARAVRIVCCSLDMKALRSGHKLFARLCFTDYPYPKELIEILADCIRFKERYADQEQQKENSPTAF